MKSTINHTFAILAYKDSVFLDECVKSLLNQSVKSDIAIYTSTPSSYISNISKKYSIPLIINKKSYGIASDWSFAYNECKTQYVTLAHQDDIYMPEYAEQCFISATDGYHRDVIIFTDYEELVDETTVRWQTPSMFIKRLALAPFFYQRHIGPSVFKKMILYFGNPISCPSVMYNKSTIGHFEFCGDFLCSLDWDVWIRLIDIRGTYGYVNRRLMIHRIHKHAESIILTKSRVREEEERILLERIWPRPIARFLSDINRLFYKGVGIYL